MGSWMTDSERSQANLPVKVSKSKMTSQDRRRWMRSVLLAGGVFGAAVSGYLPLAYAQKRLRPPVALMKKSFGILHQVRTVRPGVPGAGDQAGRLGGRFRCWRALYRCTTAGVRLFVIVNAFCVCPTILAYIKPSFLPVRAGAVLAAKPVLLAKEKDPEPTLNLKERMGVALWCAPNHVLPCREKGSRAKREGRLSRAACAICRWTDGSPFPLPTTRTTFPSATFACPSARLKVPFP